VGASAKRRRRLGMTAWLVTWEAAGPTAARQIADATAALVMNSRVSGERMAQLIELTYVNATYSPSERLSYAKRRGWNPYPAVFDRIDGVPWSGQIFCGHNPYLFGRIVDNLRVEKDSNAKERFQWTERARPVVRNGRLVREP